MEPAEPSGLKKKVLIAIVVAALIAVVVTAQVLTKPAADQASNTRPSPTPSDSGTPTSQSTTATGGAGYRNGTYAATGRYNTPGQDETVGVSLTIENDTVTAANVTRQAVGREAKEYQDMFISGYKSHVVGKSINDLQLSRVSGSSLTPRGFNDALTQIKAQAKP